MENALDDPKKFWNYIKGRKQSARGIATLKHNNNLIFIYNSFKNVTILYYHEPAHNDSLIVNVNIIYHV